MSIPETTPAEGLERYVGGKCLFETYEDDSEGSGRLSIQHCAMRSAFRRVRSQEQGRADVKVTGRYSETHASLFWLGRDTHARLVDKMSELTEWNSFYVIVGSSAGALIGLQFVVLTLIAERPPLRAAEAGGAFATPSVVHFAVVLLLSAVVSAPWHAFGAVAVVWGLVGVSGIVYAIVIARRMRVQTVYQPVFEDWLFHVLLPLAAYAMLAVSAFVSRSHARPALFVVGAATLLLLFVGIHNAWDAVTYHVFVNRRGQREAERNRSS